LVDAGKFFERNIATQKMVDSYQLSYDDLEDEVRNRSKSKRLFYQKYVRSLKTDCTALAHSRLPWRSAWDNLTSFQAFPRFGGTLLPAGTAKRLIDAPNCLP
jgi:hypothetical protein